MRGLPSAKARRPWQYPPGPPGPHLERMRSADHPAARGPPPGMRRPLERSRPSGTRRSPHGPFRRPPASRPLQPRLRAPWRTSQAGTPHDARNGTRRHTAFFNPERGCVPQPRASEAPPSVVVCGRSTAKRLHRRVILPRRNETTDIGCRSENLVEPLRGSPTCADRNPGCASRPWAAEWNRFPVFHSFAFIL